MHLRPFRLRTKDAGLRVLDAESVLLEQYGDLVRLAHLVLPASLGRHRRVLLAHSLVQGALPGARTGPVERSLCVAVLQGALAHGRRPRLWPRLPFVVGLRLFPRSGGAAELALAQRLSGVSAAGRAAFVLCVAHALPDAVVHDLLKDAGVADPAAAVRAARTVETGLGESAATLLVAQEFDACALQAGPTDLVGRRRRARLGLGVAAVAVVTSGVLVATAAGGAAPPADRSAPVAAGGAGPAADLVRAPAGLWDNTSRVDFTAWPARGPRVRDEALLGRALASWTHRSAGTRVVLAAATTANPPVSAPQLLYAGEVDGRAVVLLYDGRRLARYSEPGSSGRAPELNLARVDDADVTTAAAVTLGADDGHARYVLAPWVAEAQTRDLTRPEVLGRPLHVTADGVTDPVPVVPAADRCGSRPVLQLRSSARIAERHAFLLAGLGDLSPVHLTYTPLPGRGTPPARQPREATGTAALLAWAHQACSLESPGSTGVRAVNVWDFAEQELPDGGGRAVWSCARADGWRGSGEVTVSFRTSRDAAGAPARAVARAQATAACSRFGQHVVAARGWRSPKNRWFVLAAGSRAVVRLSVSGDVSAVKGARTLAVPASQEPRVVVRARLNTGEELGGIGSR
ncbi:hypothetical protein [Streptomyces sp. NBC_01451]|uniref:hypothetical protein n=1 Tax=Streptomyces sp. NBC_01451 TaxID=2903872 RepID=UPI002E338BAA|nr:hypothetical protein [Streptomyces sp. NBC_01451]